MLEDGNVSDLLVTSAGLAPLTGATVADATANLIESLGGVVDSHRARALQEGELAEAGLVLTATRAQRSEIVKLHPPAVRYTFTIRQYGRVLQAADRVGDRLSRLAARERLISLTEDVRHHIAMAGNLGEEFDVIDPFGRRRSVHTLAAVQMLPALNLLADKLGGMPVKMPPEWVKAALRHGRWRRRL